MPDYRNQYTLTVAYLQSPDREIDRSIRSQLIAKAELIHANRKGLNDGIIALVEQALAGVRKGDFDKLKFENDWIALIEKARSKIKEIFESEPTSRTLTGKMKVYWSDLNYDEDQTTRTSHLYPWRQGFVAMLEHWAAVSKLIVETDKKWTALKTMSGSRVDPETQAIKLINEALTRAIASQGGALRKAIDIIGRSNDEVDKVKAKIPTLWKSFKDKGTGIAIGAAAAAAGFTEALGFVLAGTMATAAVIASEALVKTSEAKEKFKTNAKFYQKIISEYGYTIGMFKENKILISKFLDRYNMNDVRRNFALTNTVFSILEKEQSNIINPIGLRNDLVEFVNELVKKAQLAMTECEAQSVAFESKNKAIFVGAIFDDTIQTLTNINAAKVYLEETRAVVNRKPDGTIAGLSETLRSKMIALKQATDQFATLVDDADKLVWLAESAKFRQVVDVEIEKLFKEMIQPMITYADELERDAAAFSSDEERAIYAKQLAAL